MNVIEKKSRSFLCIIVVLVLVLVPVSQAIPPAFPVTSSSTGILIPLYSAPYTNSSCHHASCFNWNLVNQTKNSYPHVPIFVIINPDSGSCAPWAGCPDPQLKQGIANLTKSGVIVLGYTFTSYGNRTQGPASIPTSVENDTSNYTKWYKPYGLKGIMFDEFPGTTGKESYYSTITNYVHNTNGLTYSFANPGTDTSESYISQGTADELSIYEGANETVHKLTNSSLQGSSQWHTKYDKSKFSFVLFNATALPSQKWIQGKSVYVGFMYLTDNTGCGTNPSHPANYCAPFNGTNQCDPAHGKFWCQNPWNTTASYLSTLTSYLNTPSILLTTQSVNLTGYPFTGQYTVINQSGNTIRTGYTQLVLNGTSGFQYVVKPQNYQQYVFDHWDGNSTDRKRTTTPSKNTILTAYYETPVKLTVKSVDLYGRTITGYFTVIKSSTGQTLATGYTPFTFTGSTGVTYTAKVDNFNNVNFTHWDTGSTSDPRTITPVRDTTISAYYNNSTGLGAHSTYKINIQSKSLVGDPVTGLFVRIYNQGGSLNTTGYTPLTFTANNNKQYSVVSTLAYQQWHWNHWDGGSTNTNRTFTALVGQNLTEYYTVPTNIAVNTVDSGGNPLSTGLTFKIFNSTGLAAQGIPSFTYTGSSNYTYTIQAGNSSSYKFSHWDYTASTNLNRTLTSMSNTIITAYYKN